jgi:Eukaryotic cytochrome b561
VNSFLSDGLTWLLLPLSGSANHELSFWAAWHGRIMVFCWGIVLPLGVLAARFFKVMPLQDWPAVLDNQTWWKAHLHGQSAAIALACLGVALIWNTARGQTAWALWHSYMGWTVMALGLLQAAAGFVRGSKGGPQESEIRGDHYDMTPRRNMFERTHKSLGYAALLLALSTVFMGLLVADAPRWMVLVIGLWWLMLCVGFVWLQKQGRCIDTYQALWGPDTSHPGNRVSPIGWGVHRYSRASFAEKFKKSKETT